MTVSTEQGFAFWAAWGNVLRGWALAEQGHVEEGIAQLRQGLATHRAAGTGIWRPYLLALLAEACKEGGQTEEGLTVLAEALAQVEKTGECWCEAELYRLKGELTLQQFKVQGSKFKVEESSESGVKTSLGQAQDKSQTSLEQVETSQGQSEIPNT
jgi:predicted ATPase